MSSSRASRRTSGRLCWGQLVDNGKQVPHLRHRGAERVRVHGAGLARAAEKLSDSSGAPLGGSGQLPGTVDRAPVACG